MTSFAANRPPGSDEGDSSARRDRRIAVWLALAAFALFALVARGYVDNIDSQIQFASARQLLDTGSTSLRGTQWGEHRYAIVAPDGRCYMPYGPGTALLYIPGLLVGRGLHGVLGLDADKAAAFFCSLVSPVAAALTVALLYAMMRRLRSTPAQSLAVCVLFGLGTYALVYARSSYYELTMALAFATSFHLLTRDGSSVRDAFVAGAVFAVAVTMKAANFVLVPAWVIVLASTAPVVRRTAAFAAPVAVAGLAFLWWNFDRFGSPLETGYGKFATFGTPFLEGLWRVTMAGRGGWFLFSPVMLLAIPGMILLWRIDRSAAGFVAVAFAATLVVSAKYTFPEGGEAYGPRYLVPVTVFASVPAGLALVASRGWARVACVSLLAVSVAVQLPAVIVSHQDYWQLAQAHSTEDRARLPPPVIADAILAREKLLGRDDPWDLGCLGVVPKGTAFRTVYPALPGANVWWVRAARNYNRPWAMLGAIPLVLLFAFATWRLRRATAPAGGEDAAGA